MNAAPPRLAERLLSRALALDPARAAILGDLQEDYARVARRRSPTFARAWYWREALLLSAGRLGEAIRGAPARRTDARRGAIVRSAGAGSGSMRAFLQDAGQALRVLSRSPGFALFTAAMIALGVGAATTVFSVLRPLVLAPLPLTDAEELVWIENAAEEGDNSLTAVTSRTANLLDFKQRARAFEGLTGYNAFFDQTSYTLTGDGESERLVGVGVAPDFLEVLGVSPLHGRSFSPEEEQPAGPPVAILAHGFWIRRFAGDPSVVGRTITVNGTERTVVGVLPSTFDFASLFTPGRTVDFLLPYRIPVNRLDGFVGNILFMVGRLRDGTTAATAQSELDQLMTTLQQEDPQRWGLGAVVSPLSEHVAGPFRDTLRLLTAAAGTLLLIVCVNVSNLLLARAPERMRELAVRKALGASRGRLVRQLLLESLALAGLGALLGSGLAWGATRLVARSSAIRIPLLGEVRVEQSALLFAIGLAALTGVVIGAIPAIRVADGGESVVLRSSGRSSTSGRRTHRLREGLVFAQVTLACTLLVVGGLLMRSFQSLAAVDLGFDPSSAVAWQVSTSRVFEEEAERARFYAALSERVAEVPGVDNAGLIDGLPLGRNRSWTLRPADGSEDAEKISFFPHVVDPGYVGAMRIDVIHGRNLSRADDESAPRAVLMNESAAKRIFGGQNPIGRRIRIWTPQEWEVVGVVADVRDVSLDIEAGVQVYFPIAQMPDYGPPDLVVRSTLTLEELAPRVAAAMREVDPAVSTRDFWPLGATVDRALSARRFTLWVLGAFASAALLLAGLGIYGVLRQVVEERRSEIGIRVALGASATGIVWQTLVRMLALVALGVAAGAAVAFAGGRLVGSLLYQVSPSDPVTFVAMGGVLLLVAGIAAVVPATRAARTPTARVLQD